MVESTRRTVKDYRYLHQDTKDVTQSAEGSPVAAPSASEQGGTINEEDDRDGTEPGTITCPPPPTKTCPKHGTVLKFDGEDWWCGACGDYLVWPPPAPLRQRTSVSSRLRYSQPPDTMIAALNLETLSSVSRETLKRAWSAKIAPLPFRQCVPISAIPVLKGNKDSAKEFFADREEMQEFVSEIPEERGPKGSPLEEWLQPQEQDLGTAKESAEEVVQGDTETSSHQWHCKPSVGTWLCIKPEDDDADPDADQGKVHKDDADNSTLGKEEQGPGTFSGLC